MNNESRMNLQLFAEAAPAAEAANAAPEAQTQTETETPPSQQTYTLDEIQKLIQTEADKRVTQALDRQRKLYEKKLGLAGLDEQQRALAERDQQIEELREQLREANAIRAKADLVQTLAARGLPTSFADLIDVGDDAEEAQRRVEALDKGFRAAVEEAVKARLSGNAPGKGKPKTMTREEFGKLPIAQMQRIAREQPEVFATMTSPQ